MQLLTRADEMQWRRGSGVGGGGGIVWAFRKLSASLLVGKLSSKNAKFWPGKPSFKKKIRG